MPLVVAACTPHGCKRVTKTDAAPQTNSHGEAGLATHADLASHDASPMYNREKELQLSNKEAR